MRPRSRPYERARQYEQVRDQIEALLQSAKSLGAIAQTLGFPRRSLTEWAKKNKIHSRCSRSRQFGPNGIPKTHPWKRRFAWRNQTHV